ncbi:hypothetical protein P886_4232 [Alteromonadaceae bacterium 2753L.S.0a.02]|nr:hypothetical protein P886_4232 [Alteromonadaceae bacterium 2753L.S.0a.02]
MSNGKMIIVKSADDVAQLRNMNRVLRRPAVRNLVISPDGQKLNGDQATKLCPRKKRIVGLFNEGGNAFAAPVFSLLFLFQVLLMVNSEAGLSFTSVLLAFLVALGVGLIVKTLVLVWSHHRLERELQSLYTVLESERMS